MTKMRTNCSVAHKESPSAHSVRRDGAETIIGNTKVKYIIVPKAQLERLIKVNQTVVLK